MSALLEQLQAALTDRYAVSHELGRGGMSVVFLARDLKHDRDVALKVLRPELAASIGADRFLREIRITAQLNHPHILSVYDSGEADGLLYYVMPFVEGESLRQRLLREARLSVSDTLGIARQVAAALSYAHTHGLIHRDVKPENILLSDDEAVVADFGIARAISAAGGEAYTVSGLPLGTLGYMSPEQAMGNMDLDGRTDVYSLGCVLYEMLLGSPPGMWSDRHSLSTGQFQDTPPDHRERLDALPRGLERILVKALAERPDERFQNAKEMTDALASAALERRTTVERVGVSGVVGLYLLGSIVALALTRFLVQYLGIPQWALYGVAAILVAGVPMVAGTAWAESRRANGPLRRWLQWRRTVKAGAGAMATWAGLVCLFLAMRAFGLGPLATLVGSGVFGERERVILADLENHTTDTLLAAALTEALRIDLTQSRTVSLVQPEEVGRALARTERPSNTPLTTQLAREIALREGVKAVIAGEINSAGSGFILSGRVVSAASGETLAAHRESAVDLSHVIAAIDRLSRGLRERIGESLRSVRASEPLERVTTASLGALRRYTAANRAAAAGDRAGAAALLREAIALDTAFAMAYRRLALVGMTRAEQQEALQRAYDLRDRLSDRERLHVLGTYHTQRGETEQAIATYRQLLDLYPDESAALTNLAFQYLTLRQPASAESLYRRVVELDSTTNLYTNLVITQVALGDLGQARFTIERFREKVPTHPYTAIYPILMAVNDGHYDSAEVAFLEFREAYRENPAWSVAASIQLAQLALLRGRLSEADGHYADAGTALASLGLASAALDGAQQSAFIEIWFRGRPSRGVATLDSALALHPLAEIPPPDRPYGSLISLYAMGGWPDRARALFAEYRSISVLDTARAEIGRQEMLGWIALAEQRGRDAIAAFRAADRGMCSICVLPMLGGAYDLAQMPDSTIAVYERYLGIPWITRLDTDMFALPAIHERLGQLYAARGDHEAAIRHYTRFIDLWEQADPALQPRVRAARETLRELSQDGDE